VSKLLKRLKSEKKVKRKVSFLISEKLLERLEELMSELNYSNKSKFVEQLLDYALGELERELKRTKKEEK
jgi:metal-responsive CopG/Arc/MetJ family transcriptional regulator